MADSTAAVDNFFQTMMEYRLHSTLRGLQYAVTTLFEGVTLRDKRVLDIGGGSGLHSFYCATQGASEVVCLEPESAGATQKISQRFAELNSRLSCDNVELRMVTFQEFEPGNQAFDIILLHNSINHLDEPACIRLGYDEAARESYHQIFVKLFNCLHPAGKLIICDCTRYNVFGCLGMRSPICPAIEWHKHQTPQFWSRLLSEVGFVRPRVAWSSFSRFGPIGHRLLGNPWMAFFLNSHFRLTMDRP